MGMPVGRADSDMPPGTAALGQEEEVEGAEEGRRPREALISGAILFALANKRLKTL
jgi:hypothetical protein